MSHHACCALRVCCPESGPAGDTKRADAVVAAYEEAGGAAKHGGRLVSADWLLAEFDLVPKGVGAAIADGYRPFIKENMR